MLKFLCLLICLTVSFGNGHGFKSHYYVNPHSIDKITDAAEPKDDYVQSDVIYSDYEKDSFRQLVPPAGTTPPPVAGVAPTTAAPGGGSINKNPHCPTLSNTLILYAHSRYCHKYYSCQSTASQSMMCGTGQIFSSSEGACIEGNRLSCRLQRSGRNSFSTTNACRFFGTGALANPNSCNSFFTCEGSRLIVNFCPLDLIFDPVTRHCELPNLGVCPTPTTTTTTTTIAPVMAG